MAFRGSQFGQFADPNFGASLSHSSAGAPGVLPTPDQAGPSASATPQAPAPQRPMGRPMLGPGLMSSPGNHPGSIFLAEGGMIPGDETQQDSGNAMPAGGDPFGIIQQALTFGRKKMGLPETFFGDKINRPAKEKPTNDAEATNKAAGEEGSNGQLQDDDLRAFQNNQINNNLQPGEQGQWGDTTLEGKDKTAYLAEGGAIDEDTGTDQSQGNDNQTSQGVIPDGGKDADGDQDGDTVTPGGSRGSSQQSAMAYLTGQGGITPDIAAGLERQVDPRGQMPESLRKMMAVASAGSPDKAFQVMQHYRQKFNAYTAFAQAALQGSGGRPPNPQAAADALNKAYAHVPDGNEMRFTPTQGGFQVASRKVIPSKPAPSGGEDNSQTQGGATQMFEDGGPVNNSGGSPDDEDFNYETAGSQTPSGSSYDRAAQATAAQDDYVPGEGMSRLKDALTPKRDENSPIQNFLLSFPMIKKWVTNEASFDKLVETGEASPPSEAAGPGPDQGPEQPAGDQGVTSQRGADAGLTNPLQGVNQREQPRADKTNPVAFGRQLGTQAADDGATFNDLKYHIGRTYQSVGESKQYNLAMAAAISAERDRRAKIEQEQTKGESANERARITGGYGVQRAQVGAEARQVIEGLKDNRQVRALLAKASEAQANRDANAHKVIMQQLGATVRTQLGNFASPESIQEAMTKLQQFVPQEQTPQQPQQPQQTQKPQQAQGAGQQPSARDIEYLKANPNVAAKFDARFGAGASQRVLGQ